MRLGERDRAALGAAADRAGYVQAGCGLCSPGENEAPQRLESLVDAVAEPLEPFDLPGRNPQALAPLVLERDGEVGAQVEEVVLDLLQPGAELGRELLYSPPWRDAGTSPFG